MKKILYLVYLLTYLTSKQSHSALTGTQTKKIYDDGNDLIVQLVNPVGKIHGHTLRSRNGIDYYAFQDVPYAQPPVGERRFQPPTAPYPWDGVLETTTNRKICPQLTPNGNPDLTETEDCLVLNIYSPVKPGSNASLPVFFWIHGGAFYVGDGSIYSFNPGYLIDYEIVIVTINYRLGALGFLTTNDQFLPGNLGLKDQQFALKWTHDNIHLFGGDPQQITVGGESAGSMSAGIQHLTRLNKGLLKGVIQQSGASVSPAVYQPNYRELAFQFGKMLDQSFNSYESSDLLKLLQLVPQADISRAQAQTGERFGFIFGITWRPIVEDASNKDAIVIGPIHDNINGGNFNLVPLMIGFNSEESLAFFSGANNPLYVETVRAYDNDARLLISNQLNVAEANKDAAGKQLKALYTSIPFSDNTAAFVRYTSDEVFIRSTIRQAECMSKYVPVHLYELSKNDNPGEIPGKMISKVISDASLENEPRNKNATAYEPKSPLSIKDTGLPNSARIVVYATSVEHAADLAYLWDMYPVDEGLRRAMLKLWTNFIKTQNPTPGPDEDLQYIYWSTVQPDYVQYLNLDNKFEMLNNPRQYREIKDTLYRFIEPPYNFF